MTEDRPSFTSTLVAFSRAVANLGATAVRGFHDPVASTLLPAPFSQLEKAVAWSGPIGRILGRGLALASSGSADIIALRTMAIDEALGAALARGVAQVVILGAGLDARAYRLPALAQATVFEVDHPATQRFKRSQLGSTPVLARELVFVAVDFARDRLVDALIGAGHRSDVATFWIWEGVTMYLPREVTRATLEQIVSRSALKSGLAVSYLDPATYAHASVITGALRLLVRWQDEPFLGYISPAEMRELLLHAGFAAVDDTSSSDWSRRYSRFPQSVMTRDWERLAIAS